MPLPWKKAKVTRISRLVADLQQSPKHGGSLVVETGFPTSLVDLFVKNRDCLKKPSKKKLHRQIKSPLSHPPSPPRDSSGESPSPARVGPCCEALEDVRENRVEEIGVANRECDAGNGAGDIDTRAGGGSVLATVLKVFLVVALALGSRKFAVGIMIAAFLLLFVEYVGRRFLCFVTPGPEPTAVILDSWIRKGALMFKRWYISVSEEGVVADSCGSIELAENSGVREIQIVESSSELVEPTNTIGQNLSVSDRETAEILVEEEGERIEVLLKSEGSRRAKMKAKFIKKFVPKKLRNGKKGRKSSEKVKLPESSSDESSHLIGEIQEKYEEAKEEESCRGVKEVLWVEKEMGKNGQEKGKQRHLILLGVVLCGLLGGRILALVLTVAWSLILKRSINLLGKQSRVPISS